MTDIPLSERIQDLLEGNITPHDYEELQHLLTSDEAARTLYLEMVDLHNLLCQYGERPSIPGEIVPIDRILARQKRRSLRWACSAALVAITIAVLTSIFIVVPEPPAAKFKTSPGSEFIVTHSVPEGEDEPKGKTLAPGSRIKLFAGAIELNIGTGVRGLIRAPADFTLQNEALVELQYGTAWFGVASEAVGFQVGTPEFLLTDLGTEFGIASKPDAPDAVHVFVGRVEVANRTGSKEMLELSAEHARETTETGGWATIEFDPDPFFKTLPKTELLPPHYHWPFEQIVLNGRTPTRGTMQGAREIEMRVGIPGEGPVLAPGRIGQGFKFDRDGDNLVSNWPGISGSEARTVAFWIKLPEGASSNTTLLYWGARIQRLDVVTNNQWAIRVTDHDFSTPELRGRKPSGKTLMHLDLGGSNWFLGTTDLTKGVWHHISVTYSGIIDEDGKPEVRFYLNGHPERAMFVSPPGQAGGLDTDTRDNEPHPLTVGRARADPRASCNATLDELYIFDQEISPESIRALANP